MLEGLITEGKLDSYLDRVEREISSGTIDRRSFFKSAIAFLKSKISESQRVKMSELILKIIADEQDNNLKDILVSLLKKGENVIKLKPRRILEILHELSSSEKNLNVPLNLYIYRGKQYLINKETKKAIELFKFVNEMNRNTSILDYLKIIHLKLSNMYISEEKYEKAVEILNNFCKIEANDVTVNHQLSILATLYTKLSRLESINASWDRTLKLWHIRYKQTEDKRYLDKILAKHKYFVAKFVELQKWDIAKKELSKILELTPDDMIAKRAFVQI